MSDVISLQQQSVEAELQLMGLRALYARAVSGAIKRPQHDIDRYAERIEVAEAIVGTFQILIERRAAREVVAK